MSRVTQRVSTALFALAVLPACPFCDDVSQFLPQGAIEPAVLDLGPITKGATCPATLSVSNTGNADLTVTSDTARLINSDGTFTIRKVPTLVRLGAVEDLIIDYTAGNQAGEREGTEFELQTNDADDDGFLRASITAFVADAPVALATGACKARGALEEEPAVTPCEELGFGAVPISSNLDPIATRPGVTLSVEIRNDGNKDLTVENAVISGGADYVVLGFRRGSQLFEAPITVPAGRSGECGELTGANNTVLVDVKFAPTAIGASIGTLQVLTDGAEGSLIEVALSGEGADTNILTNPEIVRFGNVPEGSVATETVAVQNTGTETANVNESCIDVDDDGACDGLCTGAAGDTALDGALSCQVFKSNGDRDGKGFVLEPTDAAAGGDDERTIEVQWSPVAGNANIPASAVLILKSNIRGNKVFKVGLVGGNVGILDVDSTLPCEPDHCVQAAGDSADVTTWTGSTTLTLTNGGDATLTIQGIAPATDTPATIADDWTIGAPGNTVLAPGASTTVALNYDNSENDFSGVDGFNLIVDHDGAGGSTLISIRVVAPQ